MADSTPLLPESEPPKLCSLDETIEEFIGNFGWAQFIQAVLVSSAWAFDAQQIFISVFTDVQPTWHCTEPCNSETDLCRIPKSSWAWDRPEYTSIISEWGIECAGSIVTGLPASSFFIGCLAGGLILATLADSTLGRKKMLFLCCLIMSLAGLLSVFSTNIWMYSVLRFIAGFGRATIGTSSLVLSTELVGKKWRGQVGTIGFLFFTLGFLSLPLIAYINEGYSWRNIYLCISIPTILYCILVHLFVHESPRWLFVQGRKEEAITILNSMASTKRSLSFSGVSIEPETWNADLYSALKILVQKGWAFRRLLVLLIASFGIGLVYYGMPLGLGNLSFNLYLSVTLNALSELPASLVTFFLIGKLNRKASVISFSIFSGVCSLMCVVMGQIGLEIVSFFSACTAFNVLLIYTLELFPTSVRNSAMSMVRQAVVLGGAFSPLLVASGRKNGFTSYFVFGIVISFCGLFVSFLPETRGRTLCDTLDEEERKQQTTRNCMG